MIIIMRRQMMTADDIRYYLIGRDESTHPQLENTILIILLMYNFQ